jgi:hypothetical protein
LINAVTCFCPISINSITCYWHHDQRCYLLLTSWSTLLPASVTSRSTPLPATDIMINAVTCYWHLDQCCYLLLSSLDQLHYLLLTSWSTPLPTTNVLINADTCFCQLHISINSITCYWHHDQRRCLLLTSWSTLTPASVNSISRSTSLPATEIMISAVTCFWHHNQHCYLLLTSWSTLLPATDISWSTPLPATDIFVNTVVISASGAATTGKQLVVVVLKIRQIKGWAEASQSRGWRSSCTAGRPVGAVASRPIVAAAYLKAVDDAVASCCCCCCCCCGAGAVTRDSNVTAGSKCFLQIEQKMLSCVLYDRVITHLKIFVFIYGPNT